MTEERLPIEASHKYEYKSESNPQPVGLWRSAVSIAPPDRFEYFLTSQKGKLWKVLDCVLIEMLKLTDNRLQSNYINDVY